MKAFITRTILLAGLLFSVASSYCQTPIQFNNNLVAITDTLYAKGQAWGLKFNEVSKTKEYSKLSPLRLEMEAFLDKKINEIRNMKDVGSGCKEYKAGMIDFLNYEKRLSEEAFKGIEILNANSTPAEISTAYQKLKTLAQEETAKMKEFNKVQEAYAVKNGFKIEDE